MGRARIRDLGIQLGIYPIGPNNAITDVPGVLVGHTTLNQDEPNSVHTGITVIVPRDRAIGHDNVFAGFHRFNGCGEMTGVQWIEETGTLTSAIALTNTHQIGMVHDALAEFSFTHDEFGPFYLPVVAETFDGFLNDMSAAALTKDHVFKAMLAAKSGPVAEGNVGGGTGMICHDFKGGIGTSSRIIEVKGGSYTVGALVQTNYGDRNQLRVDGVPVGREINAEKVPIPWRFRPPSSSIIVIIATDAPILGDQCKRLAQRATSGLARVGGVGHNTSGDLFLAFATGHHIPARPDGLIQLGPTLPASCLNPFFDAVAEAVEESILNALTAAETMNGFQGRTAYALPLDQLKEVMVKYGRQS
ncbi:MAG: P1 family peptidase [Anaerolineaceae bacterium]|nr:P1 family peptidase [Anaerolineaceae bacterium]